MGKFSSHNQKSLPIGDIFRLFEMDGADVVNKITRGPKEKKGDIAGRIHPKGYRHLRVKRAWYYSHRIAWVLHYGCWPDGFIDHISGDKLNNSKENLRLVSLLENNKNRPIQNNNKSGVNGVYWHKRDKRWAARVRVNGGSIHVGNFHSLEEAERKIAEVYADCGFHENHGRKV